MKIMEPEKLIDVQMMGILSVVSENPGIKNSDIKSKLENRAVLTKKIQELSRERLILETRRGRYNLKTYVISDFGQRVLDLLLAVEREVASAEPAEGAERADGMSRSC
jgi:predicted transcriptional regulator